MNPNSLNLKFISNLLYIEQYNVTVHFIALTEIRMHEHRTKYHNIPDYNAFFSTRTDGHGGCALYVHDSLLCNCITIKSDLNVNIVMVNLISLNINIAVVYKQPTVEIGNFTEILENLIENTNRLIIVGDTNINLLRCSNVTKRYTD